MMHRTWGWVGIVSGAVIAGTGVTLAVLGSSQKKDGEAGLAEHERKLDADEPPCDAKNGYKGGGGSPFQCDTLESDAQADVDAGRNKSIAGYVGIGVGGALAVTGVVLLLTGDDPDKYEHPKARSSGPRFAVVPGPGDVGTALRATF